MTTEQLVRLHYHAAREFVMQGRPLAARKEILVFLNAAYESLETMTNRITRLKREIFIRKWADVSAQLFSSGITPEVAEAFGLSEEEARMLPHTEEASEPEQANAISDYEAIAKRIISDLLSRGNSGIFERAIDRVVVVHCGNSFGTGFIVAKEGYLITNSHVVHADKKMDRSFNFFQSDVGYPIEVVAESKEDDVALCRFDPQRVDRPFSVVPFEGNYEETVKVGNNVVMVGCSLGLGLNLVSGTVRFPQDELGNLTMDINSNPGDSGSPILSYREICIGIQKGKALTHGNVRADGMAFATPAPTILYWLEKWGIKDLLTIQNTTRSS